MGTGANYEIEDNTLTYQEDLRYANQELENAGDDIDQMEISLCGEDGSSSISRKAKHVSDLVDKLRETLPRLADALIDAKIFLPELAEQVNMAHNLYTSVGMANHTLESQHTLGAVRASSIALENASVMMDVAMVSLSTSGRDIRDVATKSTEDITVSVEKIETGQARTIASIKTALEVGERLEENL